jgi:hypothetical protein
MEGGYVGMRAAHAPPHIPSLLLSKVVFSVDTCGKNEIRDLRLENGTDA